MIQHWIAHNSLQDVEPGQGLHGLPGFPATAAVASDDCQSVEMDAGEQQVKSG